MDSKIWDKLFKPLMCIAALAFIIDWLFAGLLFWIGIIMIIVSNYV